VYHEVKLAQTLPFGYLAVDWSRRGEMAEDEILDWTISNAPPSGEEPPEQPAPSQPPALPPVPRRSWSRRVWVLFGAVAVLVLVFTAVFSRLESVRLRQSVELVIAQQEQARLVGDWTALRSSYTDDPAGWADGQIARLQKGESSMPILLPGLQHQDQPGHVSQFQVLGSQLVRADVIRSFQFVDGTHLTLTLPQFYQYAAGAWRQVTPPETAADSVRTLHGARVDVAYYPADADLAASLVRDLDALLTQACADWDCPPDLRVPANFDTHEPPSWISPTPFDSLLGSLTFQTIFARQTEYRWHEISLLTSPVGGYPADAAAAAAIRRAAGIQALLVVAQQLAPHTIARGDNVYLDALVAREAVRLGLEAPGLAETQIANPLLGPDELWTLQNIDYSSDDALPEALVILNQLLANRSVADERALLHKLDSAKDLRGWLAAGLGLTAVEANARLTQAAAFEAPVPPAQQPGFIPDLVLNCPGGPVLATLAGQTAPLFSDALPDTSVSAWSPDGRRLALVISDRTGMVDLGAGTGVWLPQPMLHNQGPVSWGWASATVFVYRGLQWTLDNGHILVQSVNLALFDAKSETYLPPLQNFDSYQLSPNGAWAVVISHLDPNTSSLAIIPALGGSALLTATVGSNAGWSPDSGHLVYARSDAGKFSLVTLDLASGVTHTVLASDNPSVPSIASDAWLNLGAIWSPGGDQLALTASLYRNNQPHGWIGLMSSEGAGFRLLPTESPTARPYTIGFSPDGQFLAVDEVNGGEFGTAIYSAADGRLLRWVPDYWSAGWSPAGHVYALNSFSGVSLLRDPGDPSAMPQPFGPSGCKGVVWRPK
jgi:hypothetical protein